MKAIKSNVNMIRNIFEALHNSEEELRRKAAAVAAAELGGAYDAGMAHVKMFSDCTGNYAEVTLPGGYDCACGMQLCCIVDTDSMEVCGVCPAAA